MGGPLIHGVEEPDSEPAGQAVDLPLLEAPAGLNALSHPDAWDKARRAIWMLVSALVYRWIPTPFFEARCIILRLFGGKIAKGARPYSSARIWAPWNLEMHRGACLAGGVQCYNVAPVILLESCTISQRAFLCTATHDFRDERFTLLASPIVVGARAWVAAEAFVGPGIAIGEGAVVGARAVLMGSVPPWLVVAGNPARPVSRREMKASGDGAR